MKKFLLLPVCLMLLASCASLRKQNDLSANNVIVVNSRDSIAGGFLTLNRTWSNRQTEVFLRADEKGLRFEFRCYGNLAELDFSEKKADDDMSLFGGEHIELLLSPEWENGKSYYHIAVNPAKSCYHADGRNTAWNPENFKCTVLPQKDHYSIILEFPWKTFGSDGIPADGTVWKANFCRTSQMKNSNPETSSWTGASSFHDLDQMGRIVFCKDSVQFTPRIFGCGIANGVLSSSISVPDAGDYTMQVLLNGKVYIEKALKKSGRTDLLKPLNDGYIPLKSFDMITLRLLCDNRAVWEKSALSSPSEKEFIDLDKMEYLSNEQMNCKFAVVPGRVTVKNDERTFLTQDISASSSSVLLKDLPAGRYVVHYSSGANHSTRVIFVRESAPREFDPMKENAALTAQGKFLRLDGKPFYLLGISAGSKTHFQYPPAFTVKYGFGSRKNAIEYRGVPGKKLVRKPSTGYAFDPNWQEKVSAYLEKHKKSGLRWMTLAYEANLKVFLTRPDGSLEAPADGHEIYGQINEMVKKEMPGLLTSIHIDDIAKLENYASYSDIIEFASGRSSFHALNMLMYQSDDLDFVRSKFGSRPIIMWLGGSIPNGYCRSAEEIRAGVYYTIIKDGAGNIIHMGHGGVPAYRTRFWSALSMVSREIDSFYADLMNGKPCDIKLPAEFVCKAAVTDQNELLLVILNITSRGQMLKLDCPGYRPAVLEFTPFEPRVIRLHPIAP